MANLILYLKLAEAGVHLILQAFPKVTLPALEIEEALAIVVSVTL